MENLGKLLTKKQWKLASDFVDDAMTRSGGLSFRELSPRAAAGVFIAEMDMNRKHGFPKKWTEWRMQSWLRLFMGDQSGERFRAISALMDEQRINNAIWELKIRK